MRRRPELLPSTRRALDHVCHVATRSAAGAHTAQKIDFRPGVSRGRSFIERFGTDLLGWESILQRRIVGQPVKVVALLVQCPLDHAVGQAG